MSIHLRRNCHAIHHWSVIDLLILDIPTYCNSEILNEKSLKKTYTDTNNLPSSQQVIYLLVYLYNSIMNEYFFNKLVPITLTTLLYLIKCEYKTNMKPITILTTF